MAIYPGYLLELLKCFLWLACSNQPSGGFWQPPIKEADIWLGLYCPGAPWVLLSCVGGDGGQQSPQGDVAEAGGGGGEEMIRKVLHSCPVKLNWTVWNSAEPQPPDSSLF